MDYEKFLIKNKIFPIDSEDGKWKHFKIKHVIPQNEVEKNNVKKYIENNVANWNGLYVYKNAEKVILYIGKGKPLKNRLYSHYHESFQTVSGDTKDQRWHKFFLKHQGELDVFWLELETEKIAKLLKKCWTMYLSLFLLNLRRLQLQVYQIIL
jgi:hypothetical protein